MPGNPENRWHSNEDSPQQATGYQKEAGSAQRRSKLRGIAPCKGLNNPSEQLGFYQAGKTRPLAAFTPERLPLFKEVLTFRELGQDFVYFMQRSVVGTPGMSTEAETYYRDVFRKVYDSKEWQKYLSEQSLQGAFLSGQGLKTYWTKARDIHRAMLRKMGALN